MLFHLFSQVGAGFVTLPSAPGGDLTLQTFARAGSALDLCDTVGLSIPPDSPVQDGHIMTMRAPDASYVAPHGSNHAVKSDGRFWGASQFKIRKVSGSGGSRIHHGDIVALGAPKSASTRLRWMQPDLGSGQIWVGGLSTAPSGALQTFQFFEANDVVDTDNNSLSHFLPLRLSDVFPNDVGSGTFNFNLTHEGLPQGSQYRLDINSFSRGRLMQGASGSQSLVLEGARIPITIPQGQTTFSLPMEARDVQVTTPCLVFARGQSTPTIGKMSLTSLALEAWAGHGKPGADAKAFDFLAPFARDFLRIFLGPVPAGSSPVALDPGSMFGMGRGLATQGPQANPFTITVQSSAKLLPPWPRGYTIMLSAQPFPAQGFATTPSTTFSPITTNSSTISFAADGSFTHSFTVGALSGTPTATDLFCLTVDVSPNGDWWSHFNLGDVPTIEDRGRHRLNPYPLHLRRQFAIAVFAGVP